MTRDRGGSDLIGSSQVISLTPHPSGVFGQIGIYDQAEHLATPCPQIRLIISMYMLSRVWLILRQHETII